MQQATPVYRPCASSVLTIAIAGCRGELVERNGNRCDTTHERDAGSREYICVLFSAKQESSGYMKKIVVSLAMHQLPLPPPTALRVSFSCSFRANIFLRVHRRLVRCCTRRSRFSFRHLLQHGKTGNRGAINPTNYLSDFARKASSPRALMSLLARRRLALGVLAHASSRTHRTSVICNFESTLGARDDTHTQIQTAISRSALFPSNCAFTCERLSIAYLMQTLRDVQYDTILGNTSLRRRRDVNDPCRTENPAKNFGRYPY